MPTFIMLTRLNADAVRSPKGLEQLERDAMKRVREECPNVKWLSSYAVLGHIGILLPENGPRANFWLISKEHSNKIRTQTPSNWCERFSSSWHIKSRPVRLTM
jgi:hypothetical protein